MIERKTPTLRELREKAFPGQTQTAAASRMGLGGTMLTGLETGSYRGHVRPEAARHMAEVLGVTYAEVCESLHEQNRPRAEGSPMVSSLAPAGGDGEAARPRKPRSMRQAVPAPADDGDAAGERLLDALVEAIVPRVAERVLDRLTRLILAGR